MDVTELIKEFALPIAVVGAYCVGAIYKSETSFDNKHIPLVCMVTGVGVSMWAQMSLTAAALVQGLASGLVAVGIHQVIKQEFISVSGTQEITEEEGYAMIDAEEEGEM